MSTLYLFGLFDYHIVAKIVESKLVICSVGYVGGISSSALCIIHIVDNESDAQPEKTIHLSHPLGVTAGKIIVYRNDMDPLSRNRIEIGRKGCDEGFSFAGFHFADSSLMKNYSADYLYRIMLHSEHTPSSLAANSKCFGQHTVKRLARRISFLEFGSFFSQLLVGKRCHLGFEGSNPVQNRINMFKLAL